MNVVYDLQALPILTVVLAHAYGRLEVPESLEMVLNITTAFIEQIVVDRAFFVNRHQPRAERDGQL